MGSKHKPTGIPTELVVERTVEEWVSSGAIDALLNGIASISRIYNNSSVAHRKLMCRNNAIFEANEKLNHKVGLPSIYDEVPLQRPDLTDANIH